MGKLLLKSHKRNGILISKSRMEMTRFTLFASSLSCVTMTIVIPRVSFNLRNISKIESAVFRSTAPVGSMIGGLDRPSAGKLYVDGKNLFQMSEQELVEYKRNTVGFVWQNNARQ